jgi:tetratricopeptide (TPR) repeat protein
MKPRIILTLLALISFLSSLLMGSEEDRFFYDGVRAEASGDLDQAVHFYLQAAKLSHSSNLHGNLANLYFKKKQFGHAILHFRKALLLQPTNRELSVNLQFAYEMAKTPPLSNDFAHSYFASDTFSFWCVLCAVVFWLGFLVFIYLFFFNPSRALLFYFTIGWIFTGGLTGYATHFSHIQNSELLREGIAILPAENEANQTKNISLRRFAGETNSANTTLLPGQSLIIDLGKEGKIRSHESANGKNWFLARSQDGKKKGWIKEDEFGWLIDRSKQK